MSVENKKKEFNNRVYGALIVSAINANYNADFSGQPRTLPNGDIYATDKSTKYPIKKYIKDVYTDEKVLYFKRFNPKKDDFIPFSLTEAFCEMFPSLVEIPQSQNSTKKKEEDGENLEEDNSKEKIKLKATKKEIAKALLDCIDIRLFGATFAAKGADKKDNVAISVHGPVQINYGVNLWKEGQIYSSQIMAPFRNPGEDGNDDKQATTLGRQSRLDEGHYLHHYSINPHNLRDIIVIAGDSSEFVSKNDIEILKESMRRGVSWYDSTSKAGCDNEVLVWVQLKESSKIVLPNFTTLIELLPEKKDGKCVYNFSKLKTALAKVSNDIELSEIFYNKENTLIDNLPTDMQEKDL